VWIGICVGMAVLVVLALRRPTRRAALDMPVGVAVVMVAVVALKILVYDYP
jgi:hypothetical protein